MAVVVRGRLELPWAAVEGRLRPESRGGLARARRVGSDEGGRKEDWVSAARQSS